MSLDYPTILFIFVMTNVFNIALFAYQYFFHHKKWHLSVFIGGILFQTIALLLIGNRYRLPFLYTVQISNFFFISSFALTSLGLISFDGKVRKNLIGLFVAFTLLFYVSFLLVSKNDLYRIIIQIMACVFFYGIAALSLFTNKRRYNFSIIISVALFIFVVFQLYRASVLSQMDQPYNFLKGSVIDSCYLIISLFVVSTLRIGLIMLLKEIDQNTILLKNKRIQQDKLKLEELNKTKDKLFSIIAHDLRSPFNSILGFSELLMENLKDFDKSEFEKYTGIINSSVKNTLVLLDNLLKWAKSQTGQINFHPQHFVLSLVIVEILELLNSFALAKKISLVVHNPEDISVYADEEMVKTILRNLIANAIKFTHSGGDISLTVKKDLDRAEFSISDNGVGMDEETLQTLFKIETNETTVGTANEKGSGLGLVLCKELVERQGGEIWVESELGKGTVFKFTLLLCKSV